MKNRVLFTILPLFTLPLASCGTLMGYYPDSDKYLVGDQTYNEPVTSIDIEWISGEVTLIEDDSISGAIVTEVTDVEEDDARVHTYLNDGELKIKYFASMYQYVGFSITKKLTVTYNPMIEKLAVNITSGEIRSDSLTAKTIKINLTTGHAIVNKITCEEFKANMTSGGVEVNEINTKNYSANLTSGHIIANFKSVENGSIEATSGSIDMTLPEDGGKVKVIKTSGRITTNRECSISDNVYTFGDGKANIDVKMTSGTITIN